MKVAVLGGGAWGTALALTSLRGGNATTFWMRDADAVRAVNERHENPGYLPGMNSGAFNLGAGLSFAVLFAASTLFTDLAGARAGYMGGIATGAVILVLAFGASLLIPKPADLNIQKEAN